MSECYCPYCMSKTDGDAPCPKCGLTEGAYQPKPHHLPPGSILLGRYLIGRVLGEGGFGITYIGFDLRLELKVAVKEYFPSNWVTRSAEQSLAVTRYTGASGSYEHGLERFLREARTMAKVVKQREIVSVRDFFEANDTAYIVMEYVDGTTFKELVAQRGGRIEPKELFSLVEPLFPALAAVHAAGLIHRDISPDNLMLEGSCVRLLDFGCAREATLGSETMTITLKHGFAPIEQYQHKGQGPWTDVYALSATLYYCLTGKTPPQALDRLLDDELILPRRLGVALTEQQEKALLRGMAVRQHQRFRTVEELHAALYAKEERPFPPKERTASAGEETPEEKRPAEAEQPVGTQASLPKPEETAAAVSLPAQPENAETVITAGETAIPKTEGKTEFSGSSGPEETHPSAEAQKRPETAEENGAASVQTFVTEQPQPNVSAAAEESGSETENLDFAEEAQRGGGRLARFLPRSRHARIGVCSAAVVLIVVLALVLIVPRLQNQGAIASDAESLRALLADPSVSAVQVPSGVSIRLAGDPVRIEKTLTVEEGASLNLICLAELAQGGSADVRGDLQINGMVRSEGGTLAVNGGSVTGGGLLWLASADQASVSEGGTVNLSGSTLEGGTHVLLLDEEALFAEAVSVSGEEEYWQAVAEGAQAIRLEGTFELESDIDQMCPVILSEGSSVTSPVSENGRPAFTWLGNGYPLFLYGEWTANYQADSSESRAAVWVNEGTFAGDLHAGENAVLVNGGDMEIGPLFLLDTVFVNLGRFATADSANGYYQDFVDGFGVNLGDIAVRASHNFTLEGGVQWWNAGSIIVEENAAMRNFSTVENDGSISVSSVPKEGASFENQGVFLISSPSSSFTLAAGSRLQNMGYFQYDTDSTVSIQGEEDVLFAPVTFRWGGPSQAEAAVVTSGEELREALSGPQTCIVCTGDLEVSGDLELSDRELHVAGTLTLDGGSLSVSGSRAVLEGKLDLGGGALTVSGGALVRAPEAQNVGSVCLEDGSLLVTESNLALAGGENSLSANSFLLAPGGLTLQNASLDVRQSQLRISGGYSLQGSRLLVERESNAFFAGFTCEVDGESSVTNEGVIDLIKNSNVTPSLAGDWQNDGVLNCYTDLNLSGTLRNAGEILFQDVVRLSGRLENNGRILSVLDGDVVLDGGTYTGAEPVSEP